MKIIKGQEIVEDSWTHVADEDDLPEGQVIVSLARWQQDRESLLSRGGNSGLGIALDANHHAEDIADDLEHFDVVSLNFPVFRDGRAYSVARLLRDRYDYKGEVRATGDVLRDQLFYMYRCGFDAFEVRADRSVEDALKAFDEFSVVYQPSVEEPLPLWRRRSS
jgi:uncharacterized protein (DUF934 family)